MSGTDLVPAERKLPTHRRDQILRSILSDDEPVRSTTHRARWIAPIAVASVAALVAVGAITLADRDSGAPSDSPPTATTSDDAVPLDLGPLSQAELRSELETFGIDASEPLDGYEFFFTRRIDGPNGPIPVIVMLTPSGTYVYKTGDLRGNDVPEAPTAQQPIRGMGMPLDHAQAMYTGTPGYWKAAGLYRVADSVDRVEVRVGTPGGPEPWRAATPHGGFVFWATWFETADYEPGTELTLELRAFDVDGEQIDPGLIPDPPRTITVPGGSTS
jgi:hypothetical protein